MPETSDKDIFGPIIMNAQLDLGDSKKKIEELTGATDDFGDEAVKSTGAFREGMESAKEGVKSLRSSVASKLPLGLGIGLSGLLIKAHGLNQAWLAQTNSLKQFTDATGSAAKAQGMLYDVWGKTGASLSGIEESFASLNAHGMTLDKNFEHLSASISNIHMASGVSMDALAEMTAGMKNMWDISTQASENMLNAMFQMGATFELTNTQIEAVMKTTSGVAKKMGAFWKDAEKGAQSLAKSIGGATGAMKEFGVTIEESSEFFNKILDPEQIQENMALFGRLGISVQETFDMMEGGTGQEFFVDKLMKNLPQLSKEIQMLSNPIARLKFAKNLGLDPSMVSKMAKATGAEIEVLLQDFKTVESEKKALAEKQKQRAADAGRWQDQLDIFTRQALMPFMKLVNKHAGTTVKFLKLVAETFAKGLSILAPHLSYFATHVVEPFLNFLGGNGPDFSTLLDNISTKVFEHLEAEIPKIEAFIENVIPQIVNVVGTLLSKAWPTFKKLVATVFSSGKLGKFLVLWGGYKLFGGVLNFIRSARGTRLRPMFVKDLSKGTSWRSGRDDYKKSMDRSKGGDKGFFGRRKDALGSSYKGAKFNALNKGSSKMGARMAGMRGMGAAVAGPLAILAMAVSGAVSQMDDASVKKNLGLKKGEKITTGHTAASMAAGGLSLGIAPLIDSMFGTEITPAFSKGIYKIGNIVRDSFNDAKFSTDIDKALIKLKDRIKWGLATDKEKQQMTQRILQHEIERKGKDKDLQRYKESEDMHVVDPSKTVYTEEKSGWRKVLLMIGQGMMQKGRAQRAAYGATMPGDEKKIKSGYHRTDGIDWDIKINEIMKTQSKEVIADAADYENTMKGEYAKEKALKEELEELKAGDITKRTTKIIERQKEVEAELQMYNQVLFKKRAKSDKLRALLKQISDMQLAGATHKEIKNFTEKLNKEQRELIDQEFRSRIDRQKKGYINLTNLRQYNSKEEIKNAYDMLRQKRIKNMREKLIDTQHHQSMMAMLSAQGQDKKKEILKEETERYKREMKSASSAVEKKEIQDRYDSMKKLFEGQSAMNLSDATARQEMVDLVEKMKVASSSDNMADWGAINAKNMKKLAAYAKKDESFKGIYDMWQSNFAEIEKQKGMKAVEDKNMRRQQNQWQRMQNKHLAGINGNTKKMAEKKAGTVEEVDYVKLWFERPNYKWRGAHG